MKQSHKVLITAAAIMGIAVPTASPAFASTVTPAASQLLLSGCVTPAQVESAASTAVANWSSNEKTFGTSDPAGLTINGVWFPASLDFEAPSAVSVFSCPPRVVSNSIDLATSQVVITGCPTLAQLQAAATLATDNWSTNEKAYGASEPAGVTENGAWYPAGLLITGSLPAGVTTC